MAGVQFFGNLRGSPAWAKDFGGREHILAFPAKIDPTLFSDAAGINVVAGAAIQGATSLPVTALVASALANTTLIASGGILIPSGSVLYFGGAKIAQLTADAKIGDTALTVAALPTAFAGAETAIFSRYGTLYVPSGTVVSRTYAQRDANALFHPAISTEDEIFLTMFDIADARLDNNCELYRANSLVAENYLPQYGAGLALGTSASPTALLTKLRTLYRCIAGTN